MIAAWMMAGCTGSAGDWPVLDWGASGRWVHVDHVDPERVALFEDARRGWLRALEVDGGRLPDGRALFWSGEHGGAAVYYTFWPYDGWTDLAARGEAAAATQARVGEAAVEAYDAGDLALVPPHHSALWNRLADSDYVPAAGSLDETTAAHARIEYRRMATGAEGPVLDALWTEVQQALTTAAFPATARPSWNLYGGGELVLMWLSAEPSAGAGWIAAADGAAPGLAGRIEAVMPLLDEVALVRRDDLSNLPR